MSLLVVVSGPPGAGKTTLARDLAQRLGVPLVDKDSIKDTLFDGLGWSDRARSARLGAVTWELLWLVAGRMVGAGCPLVVESNFHRPHRERLAALARGAEAVEIHCTAHPDVLSERFSSRDRHPGHADEQFDLRTQLAERDYGPVGFCRSVLRVDTSERYADAEEVARSVRELVRGTIPRGSST